MLNTSPIIWLNLLFFVITGIAGCHKVEKLPGKAIAVNLTWQQQSIDCQSSFSSIGSDKQWFIEQLQFYLSAIEVMNNNQQWQKLQLAPSAYQSNNVVFIGENCLANTDTSDASANWQIKLLHDAELTELQKLRFSLGVPFALNHLNPITQASPLNMPSMFWVWQTGHKFLRLELATSDEQWQFHLGSTGCSAPSALRAPNVPCRYPNLATFELELTPSKRADDHSYQLNLNLDLSTLLGNIALSQANSCQSSRADESCQQLFSELGLNDDVPASAIFSLNYRGQLQ